MHEGHAQAGAQAVEHSGEHDAGQNTHTQEGFPPGTRVLARFGGGATWYRGGQVAEAHTDGTYDIVYDDGDNEEAVHPELVAADYGLAQNAAPVNVVANPYSVPARRGAGPTCHTAAGMQAGRWVPVHTAAKPLIPCCGWDKAVFRRQQAFCAHKTCQ